MPILSTTHLGHSFGANDLFAGIDVKLEPKERVGLVGPNGVGKTTLLLILAGLLEPAEGEVQRQNDLTLGYLRQEAVLTFAGQANTLYEEMLSVFSSLREQEAELRRMEQRMAAGDLSAELFDAYGTLQQAYEIGGGYEYQNDIKRVLTGLGFEQPQWDTPLAHLSGGQKTRVLLARLLLEKPDLLILDEPTNHLDTAAVEWLERTLRFWNGALLIVSHDRYFLDKVVNQVWDMTPRGIRTYTGNYTSYVQQRQAAWERELKLFEREKERLEKELEFIRRHIAGGNTDIAKGKLKRLTRDIILVEEVGVVEMQNKNWMQLVDRIRPMSGRFSTFSANEAAQRIRNLKPPQNRPPQLNVKLKSEERSERLVFHTTKLEIGYPGTPLFTTDKLRLERLERVALIGPNGSGKSTFLRTILGTLPPLRGEITLGDNLRMGYFAQAHDQLDLDKRVIDEILNAAAMSEQDARNYLAHYLFRGHDVFKRVGALSGGERGRLALAVLALGGANFLLLDEPTNHLDIPSQEVLQEVLEKFDGTLLIVSHDRYLINQLAGQIWELRDGHLHVFEGTYAEFVEAREQGSQASGEAEQAEKRPPTQAEILATVPPASELSLDWIEEIAAPETAPTRQKKKRRQSRGDYDPALVLEIEDAEIWLAKIEQELEAARAAGDEEEAAWLEAECAAAQAVLDELLAQLEE